MDVNYSEMYAELVQKYLNGGLLKSNLVDWSYDFSSIKDKLSKRQFDSTNRIILSESIKRQYSNLPINKLVEQNINKLLEDNCFTVTTGHQLSILGGPAFFFTKIIEVIKLSRQINENFPDYISIPIFWMATEDHDFDEIAKVNLMDESFLWNTNQKGAVGRFKLTDFDEVINAFIEQLGLSDSADYIRQVFKNGYSQSENLADFTRYVVNELLGSQGIVIVDGDDAELKRLFIPIVKKELEEKISFEAINKRSEVLSNYKLQVNPRTINLFYLNNQYRDRIVESENGYTTADEEYSWTRDELLKELNQYPENFSPNVVLRPVYQELILPNIAYLGGGGEISYWLQLTKLFEVLKIDYPLPMVRNSYLFIPQKQLNKIKKLDLVLSDFFDSIDSVKNKYVHKFSSNTKLPDEKQQIQQIFKTLLSKGEEIDVDLEKVVLGAETKALKIIDHLERRYRAAYKRKSAQKMSQLESVHQHIFPKGILQERYVSIFQFIDHYGWEETVKVIISNSKPFDNRIKIISF